MPGERFSQVFKRWLLFSAVGKITNGRIKRIFHLKPVGSGDFS